MRDQTPYVLVRLTEGRAVVGPFVVPGRTACLRCLDAHHTDADPEWPLLVRQYADATRHDRADGVPEPVDPALAALAVAWAARDVTTYADGGRPSTWSGTLTLRPGSRHRRDPVLAAPPRVRVRLGDDPDIQDQRSTIPTRRTQWGS